MQNMHTEDEEKYIATVRRQLEQDPEMVTPRHWCYARDSSCVVISGSLHDRMTARRSAVVELAGRDLCYIRCPVCAMYIRAFYLDEAVEVFGSTVPEPVNCPQGMTS